MKIKKSAKVLVNLETQLRIRGKLASNQLLSTETHKINKISFQEIENYITQAVRQPIDAANEHHRKAKSKDIQKFVLEAYDAKKWISRRDAARKLTPQAIKEVERIGATVLKTDRAELTVYEWILSHSKK